MRNKFTTELGGNDQRKIYVILRSGIFRLLWTLGHILQRSVHFTETTNYADCKHRTKNNTYYVINDLQRSCGMQCLPCVRERGRIWGSPLSGAHCSQCFTWEVKVHQMRIAFSFSLPVIQGLGILIGILPVVTIYLSQIYL